jgi:hypothetical protein
MLQKKAVSQSTLELLISLMKDQHLREFFLVGGTALSLQIGHCQSIDLDFFSIEPFDENLLLIYLESNYKFQLDFQSKNTLKGRINEVRADFISHSYPLVSQLILEEEVRMASLEDISAMKLNAIAGNGTRLKAFIDITYLSASLTLTQMVDAYIQKYSSRNPIMVMKALD